MDFKKFIKSFGYAFRGIVYALGEQNMWVHVLATVVVISAGFYFEISATEWLVLLLICALVMALEMVNSALEALADAVHKEKHPLVGKAKDMAAGAVLLAALFAIAIAGIIFGNRLIEILN